MGRIADNFRDKARHAAEEARKAHSDDDGVMQRNREAGLHQLADNEDWLDGRKSTAESRVQRALRTPDEMRTERARNTAQVYAPSPADGVIMYGVVGAGLAFLSLFAFSRFYEIDFSLHPLPAVLVVAVVCAGTLVLRALRTRRHKRACKVEYDNDRRHRPAQD
jgi:hypothetical protein